ncbi:MAG: FHA domain-containing protein [Clostridium sp.]
MDSPGISRKHAAIMNQNGVYTIIDYGSMNGVYVNGKRVNRDERIAEKDMIQIANFYSLLSTENCCTKGL